MTTRLQELWSSAFSDFVGKTPQPTFMPGFFLKTIFNRDQRQAVAVLRMIFRRRRRSQSTFLDWSTCNMAGRGKGGTEEGKDI